MIDLMRFLADNPIVSIQARRMGEAPGVEMAEDKASITLGFEDGSFGTIMYLANGASTFPKERVEVVTAGRTLQLDNFRSLTGFRSEEHTSQLQSIMRISYAVLCLRKKHQNHQP